MKETYREYAVNLFQFAQGYTGPYYEEYVEYIYNRDTEESYYINLVNELDGKVTVEFGEIFTALFKTANELHRKAGGSGWYHRSGSLR